MKIRRSLVAIWFLCLVLFGSTAVGLAQTQPAGRSAASGESSTPEGQPQEAAQEQDATEAYRHSPMVRKLGGMVGMNPEQSATAFELTNFLVLAIAVLYAMAKFLPGALRARNSAIQKHLVEARTATEQANARLSGVEARLGKLDEQIAAMHAQSERDSARDEARIRASVEDEKTRILAAAEQEIASATSQAHKQLQQYAAELAIEQAARKLTVSAETDRLLVQGFAQRLTGGESKKGQN